MDRSINSRGAALKYEVCAKLKYLYLFVFFHDIDFFRHNIHNSIQNIWGICLL